MSNTLSRRLFLKVSATGAGAAIISSGMACGGDDDDVRLPPDDDGQTPLQATFNYGVASGDPLTTSVIIWTRVTPESTDQTEVDVRWEVATDEGFENLVNSDSAVVDADRDFTLKVDVQGLKAGTSYWYRFITGEKASAVGKTKTLPEGELDSVRLAAVSCSNFTSGYFHVYREISKRNFDAIIHLGDYIYEYTAGGYTAAEKGVELLGRGFEPEKELIELQDYRTRYAQYRSDPDLQAAHGSAPFIAVWDDHEITNDTWREGAENHNEGEGDFEDRKMNALKAYFEWMPIRPAVEAKTESENIYRSFSFGDLVDLHMLDTRLIGRDQQINPAQYVASPSYAGLAEFVAGRAELSPEELPEVTETAATAVLQAYERWNAAYNSDERTMLGKQQYQWLTDKLQNSKGVWQVLGQQVLMGRMTLPQIFLDSTLSTYLAIALGLREGVKEPTGITTEEFGVIYEKYLTTPQELTPMEQVVLSSSVPYNMDAWDGYGAERDAILQTVSDAGQNLVVLAGDTHNAWANNLKLPNEDGSLTTMAVEFATASVASPGLEAYLGLTTAEAADASSAGFVTLIDGLQYANWFDRGFISVVFRRNEVESTWVYVDSILAENYAVAEDRTRVLRSEAGNPGLVDGAR